MSIVLYSAKNQWGLLADQKIGRLDDDWSLQPYLSGTGPWEMEIYLQNEGSYHGGRTEVLGRRLIEWGGASLQWSASTTPGTQGGSEVGYRPADRRLEISPNLEPGSRAYFFIRVFSMETGTIESDLTGVLSPLSEEPIPVGSISILLVSPRDQGPYLAGETIGKLDGSWELDLGSLHIGDTLQYELGLYNTSFWILENGGLRLDRSGSNLYSLSASTTPRSSGGLPQGYEEAPSSVALSGSLVRGEIEYFFLKTDITSTRNVGPNIQVIGDMEPTSSSSSSRSSSTSSSSSSSSGIWNSSSSSSGSS